MKPVERQIWAAAFALYEGFPVDAAKKAAEMVRQFRDLPRLLEKQHGMDSENPVVTMYREVVGEL